jgi:beta-phosphoglucomutase
MNQLDVTGITQKFDVIVCGDEITNSKPDPEIFLKAAQKLSANYSNCIVIEDSPVGIKAAFNAKMVGIHVEDLKKADDEILKYCYRSSKNLFEVKEYFENNRNKMFR